MFGLFKKDNVKEPVKKIAATFSEEGRWEKFYPLALEKGSYLEIVMRDHLPCLPHTYEDQKHKHDFDPSYYKYITSQSRFDYVADIYLQEHIHDTRTNLIICINHARGVRILEHVINLNQEEEVYLYKKWKEWEDRREKVKDDKRRNELAKLY